MLCSGPELDVPDGPVSARAATRASLIFARSDYTPGDGCASAMFGLGDDMVDFEILANRPDCLSVWGLARESAARAGRALATCRKSPCDEDGEGTFDDYANVERA